VINQNFGEVEAQKKLHSNENKQVSSERILCRSLCQAADPSTGTSREGCAALSDVRCALVNAMSYRAEVLVIEPYGTEGKEEAESLAHGACNARSDAA